MAGRTDIHVHALHGIDDGPRTLTESVALVRAARAEGTSTVVATPHLSKIDIAEIPARVKELSIALASAWIDIAVLPGGELAPEDHSKLKPAELEIIAMGPPGRRWILLEATVAGRVAMELHEAADALRKNGYGVVIAHPERSPALTRSGDLTGIELELQHGSLLQVSAASLLGKHGKPVQAFAEQLVRDGKAFVIASDAHSVNRPPSLEQAFAAVEALAGRGIASELIDVRPQQLVAEGFPSAVAPSG